ncbi:MAG: DUF2145 domain-containing protein [Rubrivivax sp.]|nr:DUF2145 domain-containing protein [Rubrivivax sp.]
MAAALPAAGTAEAGASRYCDEAPAPDAANKGRMLRLAAIVKTELDASGAGVALVSRSGLDLGRFGLRYSHAGLSLKASPDTPWAVRQLYFACDERRPRLYDQGLAAFLLGMQSPSLGYISVLLLPPAAAAAVAQAALDKRVALQLLAADYSANAYPYSQRYQNCNQWVAELLASAWGGGEPSRAAAQAWLREQGYEPTVFEGSRPLFWLSHFVPWVHRDGHPEEDLQAGRYRVSMPASLEAFVQRREPDTLRLEICHDERRVVVRRGGASFSEGCVPEAGDAVFDLD